MSKIPLAKPVRSLSRAARAIAPRTNTTPRLPATRPVFRASLVSEGANGHASFVPPLRKIVFEYSEYMASSDVTRIYLRKHLEDLARRNPHVEVVVRPRHNKEPLITGFYVNDMHKAICLRGFEVNGVEKKVQLLLDASGAKIKSLKRKMIVSSAEAARGIWSGMHAEPFVI